jgi:hypothetical protein
MSDLDPFAPDPGDLEDPRKIQRQVQPSVRPEQRLPAGAGGSTYDDPAGGTQVLGNLLYRTPFFDYFVGVAASSYTGKLLEPKVKKLQDDHPKLFRFCVVADLIIRTIVVLLLIAAGAAIAYKTLS